MQSTHTHRQRRIFTAGIAIATVFGLCGVAVAGSAPRPEASTTDATAGAPTVFIPVSPLRVLDTRPAPYVTTGVPTAAKLGPNSTMTLQLAGDGSAIPATATAALLNITIDNDSTLQSFLTVWPTGETQPVASSNNALPGLVASNSMLAKIGQGGKISIYNQAGSINLVVDLVGYTVPLSTFGAPGASLASGTTAPANTTGAEGGFYIDTTNHVLYGPKTGGVWPTPGEPLGGVQGAASRYGTAPFTVTPVGANSAIPFDTAGPADGTVTETSPTTFTVSDAGLYTVDYNLALTAGVAGSVRVFVNGVAQGPTSVLTLAVTGVANSVLVDAPVGATVELRFIPTVVGTSLNLTSASIVVEQATT
ncbi:MAG: hypothetical protein JWL72_3909 [Ilumatobacteraceae bacterium]|nr:hypothetical protein [Ilumatobacteraceae bacterium]MCU1390571.1 hypothetical protein [Ilumatobacteraceae bacterium]